MKMIFDTPGVHSRLAWATDVLKTEHGLHQLTACETQTGTLRIVCKFEDENTPHIVEYMLRTHARDIHREDQLRTLVLDKWLEIDLYAKENEE